MTVSWIRRHQILLAHLAILLAVSLVTFLIDYAPVLYGDDWGVIPYNDIFQHSVWFHFASRRPLEIFPAKIIAALYGLNIHAFYAANISFLYLSAVALYFLVRRFMRHTPGIALILALLYLLYPVDYTRMWLTMYLMHLILLLVFSYALLLHDFALRGRIVSWLGAVLLLIIPLFAYEAQLGMCIAWACGLAVFSRGIPFRRRMMTFAPLALGAIYGIWRMVGLRVIGIYDTYAVNRFDLNPVLLLQRFSGAVRVFTWSWVDPARQWIRAGSTNRFIVLLLVTMVGLGFLAWLFETIRCKDAQTWDRAEKLRAARELLFLAAVGLVFFIAGYIPIIAVYAPTLDLFQSRVNLFSIPGASIFLVSITALVSLIGVTSWRSLNWVVPVALLPLLVIGIRVQNQVQREAVTAWKEQVHIWQDLFVLAPNLADETQVIFVFPGYTHLRFAQRPPLQEIWMAHFGVEVLYNNPTLTGSIIFLDLNMGNEPELAPDGILNTWAADPSYSKAVFVFYDPSTKEMRLIEDLRAEFNLSFSPAGYAPRSNILKSIPPGTGRYRYLLDAPPG